MPRKMLRAGQHAFRLARRDPLGRALAGAHGIRPERPRPDDRIVGIEIEVADRREIPVDSHGARLACGEAGRATNGIHIAERRNRADWGQARRADELLAGAALQVGGDQQWDARTLPQVFRERAHGFALAPTQNEPSDAESQCGVSPRLRASETRLLIPPDRRDQ